MARPSEKGGELSSSPRSRLVPAATTVVAAAPFPAPEKRVRLLGDVWATWAECHTRAGPV